MPVVRLGESRWAWDAKSGCRRSALGRIPAGAGAGVGPVIWASVRTVYSRARRGYGGSADCPTGADSR